MLSKHAAAYLLSHGVPSLIGFLSIAVYTKLLNPAQYGAYALIFAIAAVMNSVVFEWLRLSLLRFYPKYGQTPKVIETIKISFIGIMIITAILAVFTIVFFGNDQISPVFMGFVLLLSWSQSWNNMNLSLARAELKPKKYGVIAFTRSILGFIFGTSLIYLGFGEHGLLLGIIFGFWCAIFFPTFKTWKFKLDFKAFDKSMIKEFAQYGTPLTLTLLLGVIIHNSDRLIIEYLLTTSDTGIYSVTYDLTEQSVFTLMMIINLAAFPIAMRMMEDKGEAAAYDQVKKNISLLFFIALPAAGGFIVLAPNIANLLLGEAFRADALQLMPFIVVGALLKGFKLYCVDIMFHLKKKTALQIIPVVVAAVVNIILNFMLIPHMGIEGAAIATVAAYLIAVASGWILVHYQIDPIPFPFADFMKILLSTLVMVFALWWMRDLLGLVMILVQVITGVVVFILAALLFNALSIRQLVMKRLKAKN
ncbi:MAG: oligosaccharide flippase family protein [Bacillota bacterium]